jgi:hypothetical protein
MSLYSRPLPPGFIAPCLPTNASAPPSGKLWLHEIKHDGFRVMARKAGERVRLYSRPGNDLTYRFPLVVEALAKLRSQSCIIDGEAVACGDDGIASFNRIRHRHHDADVFMWAFDLIELKGERSAARSAGCAQDNPGRRAGARGTGAAVERTPLHATLRLPLDTEKERHHGEDSPLRRHQFKGRRQRSAAAGVLRRCFGIRANRPISRGDKDREQPSSESPLTRHRKIQLALALPFEERPGRIRAAASEKTKQNVIMAVEDRHTPRRCHQRCSV